MTREQWVILDSLFQNYGQSQTNLTNTSFKNAPTVSRIIDLLCKKKLTERKRFENDRRRYKIFLAEEGKELIEKVQAHVDELRQQGWKNLTDEDYGQFLKIMNKAKSKRPIY